MQEYTTLHDAIASNDPLPLIEVAYGGPNWGWSVRVLDPDGNQLTRESEWHAHKFAAETRALALFDAKATDEVVVLKKNGDEHYRRVRAISA